MANCAQLQPRGGSVRRAGTFGVISRLMIFMSHTYFCPTPRGFPTPQEVLARPGRLLQEFARRSLIGSVPDVICHHMTQSPARLYQG